MRVLLLFSHQRPLLALGAAVLISTAAAWQLSWLPPSAAPELAMRAADPDKAFYDRTVDTLASEDLTVVVVEDAELFTPSVLEAVRETASALGDIRGVRKVDSVFSFGALTLKEARENALVFPGMVSEDGTVMALNVFVRSMRRPDGSFEDRFDSRVSADIEAAIEPLRDKADRVFQVGGPVSRAHRERRIVRDLRTLTPAAAVLMLIVLGLRFRSAAAFIPLLPACLGVLWTLGLMAAAKIPLSALAPAVPVLIVVMGAVRDAVLVRGYAEGSALGKDAPDSLLHMADTRLPAVLPSFALAAAGLLFVAVNEIRMLRDFALAASSGLVLGLAATALLLPPTLRFFGRKPGAGLAEPVPAFARTAEALAVWVRGNGLSARVLAAFAVALAGWGVLRVQADISSAARPRDPLSSEEREVSKRLAGTGAFYVVADAGKKDAFLDPVFVRELADLQRRIRGLGLFDSATSIADHVAVAARAWSGDRALPGTRKRLSQSLMTLRQPETERHLSSDRRVASILVRHDIASSRRFAAALDRISKGLWKTDKRLLVRFAGKEVLAHSAASTLGPGQAMALLLFAAAAFGLFSTLFLSPRAGALALVPGLFPVLALFGALGTLGIPLGAGAAGAGVLAAAVTIGAGARLMSSFNRNARGTIDDDDAFQRAARSEGGKTVTSALSLALGFSVLAASGLGPASRFGALTAFLILAGLAANLLLVPLLPRARFAALKDVLSLKLDKKLIDGCPLFRGLTPGQIKRLVLLSKVVELRTGAVLVSQGDIDRELFAVLDGRLRTEMAFPDGRKKLRDVHDPGELLGEPALTPTEVWTETVEAVEDSRVLTLEWRALERLTRIAPDIGAQLHRNIAEILGRRVLKLEIEREAAA